eukprot:CAMPEP_0206499576 /NCGR_PEP_ID=MMETSP0324_2-20121206/51819_1 /ASSEMBLY_ACC=CAM_ASM_000836 /TAXON_ID=2866 /ORGANISM="Crypthecodinium cohnii, Strain Seligo" /LENGTH=113 /DNA_ID=CAMNT_0053986275 /DNA_START=292 /DNA_END=630 /DNA_ORIENTATION=+
MPNIVADSIDVVQLCFACKSMKLVQGSPNIPRKGFTDSQSDDVACSKLIVLISTHSEAKHFTICAVPTGSIVFVPLKGQVSVFCVDTMWQTPRRSTATIAFRKFLRRKLAMAG